MKILRWTVGIALVAGIAIGYFILHSEALVGRNARVREWILHPSAHTDWAIRAGTRCGSAPFLLPTDGYIGYLWDDSFKIGNRHQGIDIFGGTDLNITRVIAAADGYLTRQLDWKASVIIRIPSDPLQPGRQIWAYYTHMADAQGNSFIAADYPPGTLEQPIQAGTLLGYQGDYSGDPNNPVGVHLHFSIVRDNGKGKFLNELNIANTLDPSPYLGMLVNVHNQPDNIPVCNASRENVTKG